MHNTSVIHENRKHHHLFRLKTTWFFRSRLIGWTLFTRLMARVRVIINPRLVTSNYPFDGWWVGVDLGKHVFCDINAIPFLHEIQVFRHQLCSDTSEAQIINQNVLDRIRIRKQCSTHDHFWSVRASRKRSISLEYRCRNTSPTFPKSAHR